MSSDYQYHIYIENGSVPGVPKKKLNWPSTWSSTKRWNDWALVSIPGVQKAEMTEYSRVNWRIKKSWNDWVLANTWSIKRWNDWILASTWSEYSRVNKNLKRLNTREYLEYLNLNWLSTREYLEYQKLIWLSILTSTWITKIWNDWVFSRVPGVPKKLKWLSYLEYKIMKWLEYTREYGVPIPEMTELPGVSMLKNASSSTRV